MGCLPEATYENWAATLGKAKDAAGETTSLAYTNQPTNGHTIHTISYFTQSFYQIYRTFQIFCDITPLQKTCPKAFPISSDWDDDDEEEEEVKSENKDKDNEKKTLKLAPDSLQ